MRKRIADKQGAGVPRRIKRRVVVECPVVVQGQDKKGLGRTMMFSRKDPGHLKRQ